MITRSAARSCNATRRSRGVLFAVILVGWIVYAFFNIRQSRDELGSEIELARQPQAVLRRRRARGRRLDRVLGCSASCCWRSPSSCCRSTGCSSPIARPAPPRRQEELFVEWGSLLFAPTADGASTAPAATAG